MATCSLFDVGLKNLWSCCWVERLADLHKGYYYGVLFLLRSVLICLAPVPLNQSMRLEYFPFP
eukprot:2943472-Amphidinium_carterae.1